MAAFNFPNSPSTNDTHTENGVTYKWNGTVWKRQNASYTDATNLNVTGISTLTGAVSFGGTSTFKVNQKLYFSDGANNTFGSAYIYGDNYNLIVKNDNGAGSSYFAGNTCNLQGGGSSKTGIRVSGSNGDVEFFHNNGIIGETHSSGEGGIDIKQSLRHYGDTDTLIEFETNQINFDTGGSERLRITSDGKIGINDTSPDSIFSVKDTYIFSCAGGNSTTGMQIGGYDAGANSYNPITVRASQILFSISGTERLRIASDGKVAIGNASPQQLLHVWPDTANTTSAYVRVTAGDRNSNTGIDIGHDASGNGQVNVVSNGTLTFSTNNSPRIKISNGSAATAIGTNAAYNAMLTVRGDISGALFALKATEDTSRLMISGTDTAGVEVNLYDGAGGQRGILGVSSTDFFIKAPNSSAPMTFWTHNGSALAERLRIASDGDIGVGVASPDGRFHIMGGNLGGAGSVTADTAGNLLVLESNNSQGMSILVASDERANIYFGTPGTGGQIEAGIQYAHESVSTTADRRAMIFRAGGGERARIQTGRLLVGRTNPITITGDGSSHVFEQNTNNGYALATHSDESNKRGIGIYYSNSSGASDAIRFAIQSAAKFIVLGSGNCQNANNSYGNISDISLKENIVDAESQWDDIKNIKIRNFNFKESSGQETHKQIGVVAQELETVCPKLISTGQDGLKNVASSVLYMKAVKALQESMARIEALEAEVAALKGS